MRRKTRYPLSPIIYTRQETSSQTVLVSVRRTHRATTSQPVAQVRTDEDTGEGDRALQELPLRRPLDVVVMDDARDDRTREEAVRARHLFSMD